MKLRATLHFFRPYLGNEISRLEFSNLLNNIKNHQSNVPIIDKIKTSTIIRSRGYVEGTELAAEIKLGREEERRIYRAECRAAFKLDMKACLKGGIFSLAQQLANKSRTNILGIENQGNSLSTTLVKKRLFKPQAYFLALISSLGYTFIKKL